MKKVQRNWILAGVAITLVGAAAAWPSRSPASERANALVNGSPFEGQFTIVTDATNLQKPMTTTYEIKGSKVRFAMPAPVAGLPESVVIVDQPAKKSWLIVDERRTVLALDAGKALAEMNAAAQISPNVAIEKTGTFDTVAGYRCE